ncbi:hypothetical protein BC628DRAFT_255421 [Trametes gibbosa]|nr:hypothetical protein BC628DRAFT_255421 [Trametes gibbosa]
MRPCTLLDAPRCFFLLFSAYAASPLPSICASAALVNITIDDTFGDESNGNKINYNSPSLLWNVGQDCPACTAQPNPKLVSNGTWHDSTYNDTQNNDPSIQVSTAGVSFEGVAVYVFCVVTRSFTSPDGNSDMSFYIDDELVGRFVQAPNGDPTYEYDVPVYVNQTLANGPHTLTVMNGQLGGNKSLILLDYIVYTREAADPDPAPSPPPSSASSAASASATSMAMSPGSLAANTGSVNSKQKRTIIIAVATVCSVIGLAIIISAVSWYCIRRRRNNYNAPSGGGFIPRSPSHIEVNPATSGWAEGTWAAGDGDAPPSSFAGTPTMRLAGMLSPGQRNPSTKRKRGASDPQAGLPVSAESPSIPYSSKSAMAPQAFLSAIPAFRLSPSSRHLDPPGSPASSSWGTPASMAPPDSATYLMKTQSMASSTSNLNMNRAFLEMGGEQTTMLLSSHHAHPFANAQAVQPAPLGRSRSGTTRTTAGAGQNPPPPSAMPSAYPARAPSHRRRGNSHERMQRPTPAELSYTSSGTGTTSPSTPPSVPYTLDTDESFLPSPSPADPSPLSFANNAVPERQTSQRGQQQRLQAQMQERHLQSPPRHQQPQQRAPQQQQQQTQQTQQQHLRPSASQRRRRVDPVDPGFQPSRDLPPSNGSHPHPHPHPNPRPQGDTSLQMQPEISSRPRPRPSATGTTATQRDRRRRYGTVDVPVDADAADSPVRPPSYGEGG